MDCREFLHRYSDYDDSLVSPEEADRFRSHMQSCEACARYDRVLRKGRMLARQIQGPEPSPDFVPRLQRRLIQARAARAASIRPPRLAAALAAATILMVAATALRLMAPGQETVALTAQSGRVVAPRPAPVAVVPSLPAGTGHTRDWGAREVAPADTSTYSPLVTGPPVYRRPPFQGTADTRRALD